MKCSFEFCIYNRKGICLLDKMEINNVGMCESCIVVSLRENFLEAEKERQLREIENR